MSTTQPPRIKPHQPALYVDDCPCQDCVERREQAKTLPELVAALERLSSYTECYCHPSGAGSYCGHCQAKDALAQLKKGN